MLIILLAMLQFVAPLVHAHTGNHNFSQGFHLPGLESYLSLHHALENQLVNSNNVDRDNEGLLIVVDTGIKNPNDVVAKNDDHYSYTLITVNSLINSNLFDNDCNFSPHNQIVAVRTHFSPLSPRAPPAILSYA
ncbi:hypothetical protein MCAMS1_01092 [biofilm metagenome]